MKLIKCGQFSKSFKTSQKLTALFNRYVCPLDSTRFLTRAYIDLRINKLKLLMKIVRISIKWNWCFGHPHRWRKRPRLCCLIKKLRILPINVGRTHVQNPLDFVTALLVDRHKRGRLRHLWGCPKHQFHLIEILTIFINNFSLFILRSI